MHYISEILLSWTALSLATTHTLTSTISPTAPSSKKVKKTSLKPCKASISTAKKRFDLTNGDGQYVELDSQPPKEGHTNVYHIEEDLPSFKAAVQEYHK